jgi:hypothetical protein
MKSFKKIAELADRFEIKLKYAQQMQMSQSDTGGAEKAVILKAVSPQLQNAITASVQSGKKLSDQFMQVEFKLTVVTKSQKDRTIIAVNLDSLEVFAGYDAPYDAMAKAVSEQAAATLGPKVKAALYTLYTSPAGKKALAASGTPVGDPPAYSIPITLSKADLGM